MHKETTIQDEWTKFRKDYNSNKIRRTISTNEVVAFTAHLLKRRYTIIGKH